jgi:cytoskeletal protein RodZ
VSEAAPETRSAPGAPGKPPSGGTGFSRKFGPLPAWAWVLLAAAGGVGYIWWKNKQNASAASAASEPDTAEADSSGGDDAASIATLQSEIQQLQGAASTPAATPNSAPTGSEKTKILTVPKAETLAAYAKANKWNTATLKAVEALNGLSASSKLKRGQKIVRPVNKTGEL